MNKVRCAFRAGGAPESTSKADRSSFRGNRIPILRYAVLFGDFFIQKSEYCLAFGHPLTSRQKN